METERLTGLSRWAPAHMRTSAWTGTDVLEMLSLQVRDSGPSLLVSNYAVSHHPDVARILTWWRARHKSGTGFYGCMTRARQTQERNGILRLYDATA
jgi:hypothetical protein